MCINSHKHYMLTVGEIVDYHWAVPQWFRWECLRWASSLWYHQRGQCLLAIRWDTFMAGLWQHNWKGAGMTHECITSIDWLRMPKLLAKYYSLTAAVRLRFVHMHVRLCRISHRCFLLGEAPESVFDRVEVGSFCRVCRPASSDKCSLFGNITIHIMQSWTEHFIFSQTFHDLCEKR